jgi:hypothetical protein
VVNRDDLYRIAKLLLMAKQPLTRKIIEDIVDVVLRLEPNITDREQMIRIIESDFSISVADGSMLAEDSGHLPWLPTKRGSLEWDFWRRYSDYLLQQKSWSSKVVTKLDILTDQVLDRLEDPERLGAWDRRGLVVGQVQSGKTSHYTGLICKATDAGYKFIVVLAGVHKSLRSQTQLRLDEGFLGVDTQIERAWKKNTNKIGAGMVSSKNLHVAYLTNSADDGDFKKSVANQIGIPLGSQIPILLVVKKNGKVLQNLITWLENQANAQDDEGRKFFTDFPLLLLDDEADFASVNTKATALSADGTPLQDQDVTTTNARIRELLRMFSRSVYIGYTATPFANIFIHPDVNTNAMGQDLFPKHFIFNLPAPSNYIGPVQVFGLGEETDLLVNQNGLPITRIIDDYHNEFPSKHDKFHQPNELPLSLKQALRVFILVCATRMARGQGSEHNSMLVHVTRTVHLQDATAHLIESELKALQNRLIFGDGDRTDSLLEELQCLWVSDLLPTTELVINLLDDPRIVIQSWTSVKTCLKAAVTKITVKKINGSAKDILDYYGNPDGISVIAVGGDKLSRGLTLEGLSVSYYLRASKMYDTLMQMGRWFGYRPGYADLCRLYTTTELMSWYKHITIASEELRADFDEMTRAGRTPEDFGLKVRTHPGNLVVTGAGKLRNYTQMRVSFSGRLIESYRISNDRADKHANLLAVKRFIAGLGNNFELTSNHYVWQNIKSESLIDFLNQLKGYPSMLDFAPNRLSSFVSNLNKDEELSHWVVCLMNIDDRKDTHIAGLSVGYSGRNLKLLQADNCLEVGQRHLISPDHEWLDMTPDDRNRAYQLWAASKDFLKWRAQNPEKSEPDTLAGKWARTVRSPNVGLLLLYLIKPKQENLPNDNVDIPYVGYALSFPNSPNGEKRAVTYVVNNIFAQAEHDE